MEQGFGIWITGLPSSGKSTLTREIVAGLQQQGVGVVVLESDEMRRILTPLPAYSIEERDRFYAALADIGVLITRNGVNVLFDATANRRSFRDRARRGIRRFAEVFVDCPLEVCRQRDPKGIYAGASREAAGTVPGLQDPYEPPAFPEAVVDCRTDAVRSAAEVISRLRDLNFFAV